MLGGVLIIINKIEHVGAYELVTPLALCGVVASFALMPLVMHLAERAGSGSVGR